ncbi:MAG TPA: DUF1080 domain-containing protein [Tepidisphaeraceae bacterium]|nr:DUF1080 domain-containing protein [Tepidisphaeraceae bacterium]
MKQILASMLAVMLVMGCKSAQVDHAAPVNTLSRSEQKHGFQLLFDGRNLDQWRSFKKPDVKGWAIEGDNLICTGGGGDLLTREEFRSFELLCEWKIPPKGNSGIIYRCDESGGATWHTGIEYQLWDHSQSPDKWHALNATAACYDLYRPSQQADRPPGQWNTTRILLDGNHLEHWLNGKKVVDCEIGSDDWNARVAKSKFATHKNWGQLERGHIALQEHGGETAFRNIKIRVIEK